MHESYAAFCLLTVDCACRAEIVVTCVCLIVSDVTHRAVDSSVTQLYTSSTGEAYLYPQTNLSLHLHWEKISRRHLPSIDR